MNKPVFLSRLSNPQCNYIAGTVFALKTNWCLTPYGLFREIENVWLQIAGFTPDAVYIRADAPVDVRKALKKRTQNLHVVEEINGNIYTFDFPAFQKRVEGVQYSLALPTGFVYES